MEEEKYEYAFFFLFYINEGAKLYTHSLNTCHEQSTVFVQETEINLDRASVDEPVKLVLMR